MLHFILQKNLILVYLPWWEISIQSFLWVPFLCQGLWILSSTKGGYKVLACSHLWPLTLFPNRFHCSCVFDLFCTMVLVLRVIVIFIPQLRMGKFSGLPIVPPLNFQRFFFFKVLIYLVFWFYLSYWIANASDFIFLVNIICWTHHHWLTSLLENWEGK